MSDYSEAFLALQNAYNSALLNARTFGDEVFNKSQVLPPERSDDVAFGEQGGGADLLNAFTAQIPSANTLLDPGLEASAKDEARTRVLDLYPAIETSVNELTDKFFPSLTTGFSELSEDVITEILSGEPQVEQLVTSVGQIWDRAFVEIERSSAVERENIVRLFAGNGFSIPSGAMTHRLSEVERTRTEELNKAVAERAIANASLAVQIYTTALSLGAQMKMSLTGQVMTAVQALVSQYSQSYELGHRERELAFQAQQEIQRAIKDFYQLEVAYSNFLLEYEKQHASSVSEEFKLDLEEYKADTSIDALEKLAQSYVDVVQSIVTSQGTIAGSFV